MDNHAITTETLPPEQYPEYETFIRSHPQGNIMQSVLWHGVKSGWAHEVVVCRNKSGDIIGGMSVLIQQVPLVGVSLLYAPRGPVCDLHDKSILTALKNGADDLAQRHKGYIFKMDPDIGVDDHDFTTIAGELGFKTFLGGDGFETIQPRFNYRVYLNGRSEDELLAGLTQKARYNVRVAQRHGVEIKIMGREALDDFARLMEVTGKRDGFSVRPRSYFEGMLDALGGDGRLYMAYYQGQAVAGAVTSNYAGKCCYLYGASDNNYRNMMPTYLIQWEMMRWAAQTGCSVYDFQGVSGNLSEENNPLYGLYRFKKGFGGQVDEGPGEFDYVYMPLRAKLVGVLIKLNEWVRGLRRRLRGG
ncbi:MAG: peptidoglycan bridge formation glycyltransferase FemA/FemB family protein [Oscillospiraceae bacterium]|nr:peptidoglycan bridge formation glycyltransferase FemA/FemB family protein [Oscillospiraceae bacterium]